MQTSPEAVADAIRKLPVESLRRIIELVSLKDEGVREMVRWCSVVVVCAMPAGTQQQHGNYMQPRLQLCTMYNITACMCTIDAVHTQVFMEASNNSFRARPPPEGMDNWEMQHMQHMQQPDSFRFASTSFMLFSFKVC